MRWSRLKLVVLMWVVLVFPPYLPLSSENSLPQAEQAVPVDQPLVARHALEPRFLQELIARLERIERREHIAELLADQTGWENPVSRNQLAEVLLRESRKQGLDPFLVLALIQVESGFSPSAVSRVGARGLMQLSPGTARAMAKEMGISWRGPDELHDPVINLRLGIAYLGKLHRSYQGNTRMALTAYHCGPGCVRKMIRRHGRLQLGRNGYFAVIQRSYQHYRQGPSRPHPRTLAFN